jgi:hypothetical protein
MTVGSVLANPTAVPVSPALASISTLPQLRTSESTPVDAARFRDALVRAAPTSGTLVAPVKTNLSSKQADDALDRAWTAQFGSKAPPNTVGILRAQWALETGSGASMYNYNFAGIKGVGPSGLSVSQRTTEGFGATERHITDKFRAYSSADEGAADYIHLLSTKYPAAIDAAKNGDASGFVSALHARSYFTGDEQGYTKAIASLAGLPANDQVRGTDRAVAANSPVSLSGNGFDPSLSGLVQTGANGSFVDSVAMADELSRAALRIVMDSDQRAAAPELGT